MARIFYRFGIFLYKTVLHIAALFNKKAALWVNGRKAIWEHISKELGDYSGETIWMHCASLGEFEQGRSVLEALRFRYPEQKIVLTFF